MKVDIIKHRRAKSRVWWAQKYRKIYHMVGVSRVRDSPAYKIVRNGGTEADYQLVATVEFPEAFFDNEDVQSALKQSSFGSILLEFWDALKEI